MESQNQRISPGTQVPGFPVGRKYSQMPWGSPSCTAVPTRVEITPVSHSPWICLRNSAVTHAGTFWCQTHCVIQILVCHCSFVLSFYSSFPLIVCFAFNLFAALVQLTFYQIADQNSGGLVSKAVRCHSNWECCCSADSDSATLRRDKARALRCAYTALSSSFLSLCLTLIFAYVLGLLLKY